MPDMTGAFFVTFRKIEGHHEDRTDRSVPPRLYGGTERVVSYLTEELAELGRDVTLFASGDSISGGTNRTRQPQSCRLGGSARWAFPTGNEAPFQFQITDLGSWVLSGFIGPRPRETRKLRFLCALFQFG